MAGMADTFAKALQQTEESRDPEPLLRLFAEDAHPLFTDIVHLNGEGRQRMADRLQQEVADILGTSVGPAA